MAKTAKTKEEMQKLYGGKYFGKSQLLMFLYSEPQQGNRSPWFCRCKCGYCGAQYDVNFSTLRYGKNPNCGCQRTKPRGYTQNQLVRLDGLRAGVDIDVDDTVAAVLSGERELLEQEKKADGAHKFKYIGSGRCVSVTRVLSLWQKLPKEACCPAWQDPKKFVDWALRNGFTKDRALARVDLTKPWHPSNCVWVEDRSWED